MSDDIQDFAAAVADSLEGESRRLSSFGLRMSMELSTEGPAIAAALRQLPDGYGEPFEQLVLDNLTAQRAAQKRQAIGQRRARVSRATAQRRARELAVITEQIASDWALANSTIPERWSW